MNPNCAHFLENVFKNREVLKKSEATNARPQNALSRYLRQIRSDRQPENIIVLKHVDWPSEIKNKATHKELNA